jgi:hypothetical protein
MKSKLKIITTVFALSTLTFSSFAQLSDNKDKSKVKTFIQLVKTQQITKLATLVNYPMKREYPIPSINNKSEFIKRYHQIFDDSLKNIIINSDPVKDWSKVGWRGIMLLSGTLWIDGKLSAVNYQSLSERHLKEKLVANDKSRLFNSLRNYSKPILYMETAKFKIRIDEMEGGKYRYASWPLHNSMPTKPDLILSNGSWVPDGSGGNHYYRFTSGIYKYDCYVSVLNETGVPSVELEVTRGRKVILKQKSILLKN